MSPRDMRGEGLFKGARVRSHKGGLGSQRIRQVCVYLCVCVRACMCACLRCSVMMGNLILKIGNVGPSFQCNQRAPQIIQLHRYHQENRHSGCLSRFYKVKPQLMVLKSFSWPKMREAAAADTRREYSVAETLFFLNHSIRKMP